MYVDRVKKQESINNNKSGGVGTFLLLMQSTLENNSYQKYKTRNIKKISITVVRSLLLSKILET